MKSINKVSSLTLSSSLTPMPAIRVPADDAMVSLASWERALDRIEHLAAQLERARITLREVQVAADPVMKEKIGRVLGVVE